MSEYRTAKGELIDENDVVYRSGSDKPELWDGEAYQPLVRNEPNGNGGAGQPPVNALNTQDVETSTKPRVIVLNSLNTQVQEWPELDPDALHGLAGDIVSTLAPNTEADEAGLLLTFLVTFGAIVGPGPHAMAGDEKHPARLFTVLVGKTSRGRKGTAYASVKRIFEAHDPRFMLDQTLSGLASGEGLIAALSDTEDGPRYRRVLVYEPEFARVLKVCAREGSTLSAILRDARDRGSMRVATRKDPLKVDGAHVSVVSHITADELRRYLTETEVAGGLGNRFLLALVKRSKKLPSGGNLSPDAVEHFALELGRAVEAAKRIGLMTRPPRLRHCGPISITPSTTRWTGSSVRSRRGQSPRC